MSGQGKNQVVYVDSGGMKRRYVVHIPVDHDGPMPVVVMLDGRGGTPWTAMKVTRWNEFASVRGILMVYPEALRLDPDQPLHFLTNPQMWNAGIGGSDVARDDVDDLGFLNVVLRDVHQRFPTDDRRTYMTGFSNGASMTYRYATAYPEDVAAIAPVAGHMRLPDIRRLHPALPMITLFGKLDPLVPYEGGKVELPWGATEQRPPAIASARKWAELLGHPLDAGVTTNKDGITTVRFGREGAEDEVVFLAVDDLGHVWPGGHRLLPHQLVGEGSDRLNGNETIWSFFQKDRRA